MTVECSCGLPNRRTTSSRCKPNKSPYGAGLMPGSRVPPLTRVCFFFASRRHLVLVSFRRLVSIMRSARDCVTTPHFAPAGMLFFHFANHSLGCGLYSFYAMRLKKGVHSTFASGFELCYSLIKPSLSSGSTRLLVLRAAILVRHIID